MNFEIMTLFPDLITSVLNESIIGRAQDAGKISVHVHNIRDYTPNKHRRVDDTPYGGGMGMLMMPEPIFLCYEAIAQSLPHNESKKVIYLSPKGKILTQDIAASLTEYDHLILLCGHYEGIDQRVLDEIVDEEISIGDYVLTGGELPACVLVDSVSRMIDGVLPAPECYEGESIASGLLEYPQYTRPPVWHEREVPPVLLSGHHANIEKWRLEQSIQITRERRPELLQQYEESLQNKGK